jgi:hypothetical protein
LARDEDLPPSRLYKFRPEPGSAELDPNRQLVVASELYFAKPSTLNDPFDCNPTWLNDASDEDIRHYRSVRGDAYLSRMSPKDRMATETAFETRVRDRAFWTSKWLEFADDGHGVCSLSASATEPLLWAHYASAHRGYCVELSLEDQWSKPRREPFLPIRVEYGSERQRTSTREWLRAMCSGGQRPDLLRLLSHKDERWAYEQEWRLIAGPGGISRPLPPHCLTALILGCRCSSKTEQTLRRWVSEREAPIALRRAVMDDQDFSLTIIDA